MSHHMCPVLGCGKRVASGKLMCLGHWRRVPQLLQRAVWAKWITFQHACRNRAGTKEWGDARRRYIEAVDAAVASVTREIADFPFLSGKETPTP